MVLSLASRRPASGLAVAAGVFFLVAISLLLWQRGYLQTESHQVIPQRRRLTVAILGFDSLAGSAASAQTTWIATALEETLSRN